MPSARGSGFKAETIHNCCVCVVNVFSTCNETRSPVREMYFHHCRARVIDWVQNLVSALCRQEIDLGELG